MTLLACVCPEDLECFFVDGVVFEFVGVVLRYPRFVDLGVVWRDRTEPRL